MLLLFATPGGKQKRSRLCNSGADINATMKCLGEEESCLLSTLSKWFEYFFCPPLSLHDFFPLKSTYVSGPEEQL